MEKLEDLNSFENENLYTDLADLYISISKIIQYIPTSPKAGFKMCRNFILDKLGENLGLPYESIEIIEAAFDFMEFNDCVVVRELNIMEISIKKELTAEDVYEEETSEEEEYFL